MKFVLREETLLADTASDSEDRNYIRSNFLISFIL